MTTHSNSSQYKLPLIVFLVTIALPMLVTGQSNLPLKQVKEKLTSSPWRVATLWNPRYKNENDYDHYEWEEAVLEDSRYSYHFGVVTITFFPDGTFKGDHFRGKKVTGKWSYKGSKKKVMFTLSYEANVEEEGGDIYPYEINFDHLTFSEDSFVSEGDICNDGCNQKVRFVKSK